MVYDSLAALIGKTPLLRVSGFEGQQADLIVKLEYFNPGGSVKDRVALSMIEDAEASGALAPGATIIEPTSGNTGVVILGQFDNPANPAVHFRTTGEEIWRDTEGKVDVFVAGVGTGGTVSGTGRALKAHKPDVEIVAVEPAGSAFLSTGVAGPHKIQGIGAGFRPQTFDGRVVDRILTVTDADAAQGARELAAKAGLLVGISSGAAFSAALSLARKPEYAGKVIVALLPDTGERYLSTGLFDAD